MSSRGGALPRFLYVGLTVLFLFHQDLWLWDDARFVLGLPVGLTYHVAYCLGVSVLMALLVRFAWPRLETDEDPETTGGTGMADLADISGDART